VSSMTPVINLMYLDVTLFPFFKDVKLQSSTKSPTGAYFMMSNVQIRLFYRLNTDYSRTYLNNISVIIAGQSLLSDYASIMVDVRGPSVVIH